MRHRLPKRLAFLAPLLLVTAACSELLESVPPRPPATEDVAVAEADYPRLAEVPERPRLGYALVQRREIAEGLVADHANARYAGDTLRRDTGRPVPPVDVPPLPPLPAPPEVADDGSGDLALAYIEEALARDSDDGSLDDFLDRLEEPPPGTASATPVPVEPLVEDVPVELDQPEAPAPPAIPTVDEPDAGVAARSDPSPSTQQLPMTLRFAPDAVDVELTERQRAEELAAIADGRSVLVVSGGGPRPGLAMERARRVAAILVEAGVEAQQIAIEMGGESDVVVVYEAAGEAG